MNVPARKAKAPQVALATLEDLLAIPEEERPHELIEGTIYPKEAATGEHGLAQCALAGWLSPFARRSGGNHHSGWWFVTGVEIYFDEKNTFRPDIAGWRRERLPARPTGAPVRTRPDWVCEILSTVRRPNFLKKKHVYRQHAVPHSWIVDLNYELFHVQRWTPEGYLEVANAERGEVVNAEPFEVMPFSLGLLFGDEPDDDEDENNDANDEKAE